MKRFPLRFSVMASSFVLVALLSPVASAAGAEWSSAARDVTPFGNRVFLGQFTNETVSLDLADLGSHSEVTLSFDLYVIRSWDGNGPSGPDIWDLSVRDGDSLLHTTFSNLAEFTQAYPDAFPGGDNPAQTGAAEVNTLGFVYSDPASGFSEVVDSVYRLTFTFPHSASGLTFDFSGSNLEDVSNESWGLDNVQVLADGSSVYSEDFEVPPPVNDDFDDATVVGTLPFTDVVNTLIATTGVDDPSGCSNNQSVWYALTLPGDKKIEADTFGSSYFGEISVWTGSRGSLTQELCGGNQVVFDALGGTTYYFLVTGGGVLNFTVREAFEVGLTIDGSGRADQLTGAATISGTVQCNEATDVSVSGEVRQRLNRFTLAHGAFSIGVSCSPPHSSWVVTVVGENAPFGAGRASVSANAFACGLTNCDDASTIRVVRLRG
jgi:hypothetical protein